MSDPFKIKCPDCDTNCFHCWKDLSKEQRKCCPDCKCTSRLKLSINASCLAISKPWLPSKQKEM